MKLLYLSVRRIMKMLRIVRYISLTVGYGLYFYGNMKVNHLFAYCDVAFANRTGLLVMCCGAPLMSKSKINSIWLLTLVAKQNWLLYVMNW